MDSSLTTLNTSTVTQYLNKNHHLQYERELLEEILNVIKKNDIVQLEWFTLFGNSLRMVISNVNAYRKGLQFGFTEIEFDEYGWLKKPSFLDTEELKFGLVEKGRFGNYSTITLGRGPDHIWTFGMTVCYGTAGYSSGISVYEPAFISKQDALDGAIKKLKDMMSEKLGNEDTTNYNQKIILATLKSIEISQGGKIQLSLF